MKTILAALVLSFTCCVTQAQYDTLKTASGLKYVLLQKGDGAKPVKGQKVKVHYTGRLENGKVFDTSQKAGPFKFTLDNKEVIPGWDEGFKLMQPGEKAVLIIPPHLAYGKKGVPDDENPGKYIIPPNAELTFEVELISVK